ncbi:hypothetical protein [Caulobacter sp. DWP3-1-3b2]|uniref:hypothetical protein n=1 Tax=Caulobacter sp. DWP3-1-3b2 TaxID=2804643 RepID=UPI003CF10313
MTTHSHLFGGLTLADWDQQWVTVEGGLQERQPQLRRQVGLYRFLDGGRVMALGAAVGLPGGLCNRLHDFWRVSSSARNYRAGCLIHEHRDQLETQVLVIGSGKEVRKATRQLTYPMIGRHNPVWTVRRAPYRGKG